MSSITLSVLRGEVGKTFSGWSAQEVTGTFNAPRLVISCQSCGNRMNVDVNQWYSITQNREFRCSNASGHRTAPKAETRPQPLTLEVLNKMPSDELKRRILHEPGFKERADALYATAPQTLDRKAALLRQEAREKEAKIAPARQIFTNAYHAYEAAGEVAPTFDQWLNASPETKQAIVKRFSLDTIDWKKKQMDALFGRA